jgi:hypothetical protein
MMMSKDKKTLNGAQRRLLTYAAVGLITLALTFFCYMVNYPLIIPLLLLFLSIHLSLFRKTDVRFFINLGLLITLLVFATHGVTFYTDIPFYYIPVASIGMLTMLLFNDIKVSFVMTFISSLLVSLIVGGDFGVMITFFMGSLTGALSVREARSRGQLISAGLFVSAIHIVCLLLLLPQLNVLLQHEFIKQNVYPLIANGFISAFFVAATLNVFEYLFGVLTNFSLLEIADSNHPLLKKMALKAPGTWQHSLSVSQLSEAAANAIGVNALLTRAGAYYHDIGKIEKPEYFNENQLMGQNKHDYIEPSMSRLVILNHVKEGVELAKKNKINPIIANFIPQHHGTSIMHYFYQKNLESAEGGKQAGEESFRYPGPKPQTKEAAIILLADSVEGATRAIEEPNLNRIEEVVRKIINNKFIDGQLDECNLTLKEIEKICETFTRILGAMYHGRIKYPEKNNGNSNKKSAEKSTPQSPSNQKTDEGRS